MLRANGVTVTFSHTCDPALPVETHVFGLAAVLRAPPGRSLHALLRRPIAISRPREGLADLRLGQAELAANSAWRHTGLERGSNRIHLALGQCRRMTDLE
jgi:hypothetical protein